MQTNELTERFNQTLSRCLAKVVNESHTDWDEKIDTVLMGYRASQQASTKHSPYYMLFQQRMRLPDDNEVIPADSPEDQDTTTINERLEQLMALREKAFKEADTNIQLAQKSQKAAYDRKHKQQVLAEETEVLLENTCQKQRKGGKLEPLWLGPFTINKHLGKGLYSLKNQNGDVIKKKANINRLKLYKRRNDSSSSVTVPKKSVPPPEKGVPQPEKGVPQPEKDVPPSKKSVSPPEKSVPPPEKGVPPPEKGLPPPENGLPPPKKSVPLPEKSMPLPDKSVSLPDKSVPLPKKRVPPPEISVLPSEMSMPPPKKSVPLPEKSSVSPPGNKKPPSEESMLLPGDKSSPPDKSVQSSVVNMASPKPSTSDLENLLFDNNLLRLWRTGADEELYLPEEDGHFDVSLLYRTLVLCSGGVKIL